MLSKENYVLTDAILFHVFIYSMSDIAGRNRRNRENLLKTMQILTQNNYRI